MYTCTYCNVLYVEIYSYTPTPTQYAYAHTCPIVIDLNKMCKMFLQFLFLFSLLFFVFCFFAKVDVVTVT